MRAFSRLRSHLRPDSTCGVRLLSLLRELPAPAVNSLSHDGYAVVDSTLSHDTTAALRREIDQLSAQQALKTNTTRVVRSGHMRTFPKVAVTEAELNLLSENTLGDLPTLEALRNDRSLPALLSVFWPRLTLRESALKVQRSDSGCFPIHVDSAAEVDNRVVTALLYCHEWKPGDGGELRLYDRPGSYVDIEPKEGRMVLLSSLHMHHRVLTSAHTRYVVTMWLSGNVRQNKREGVWQALLGEFRDMTMRVALKEEWENSLIESHGEMVGEEAVTQFRENLERIWNVVPGVVAKKVGVEEEEVRKIMQEIADGKADKSRVFPW